MKNRLFKVLPLLFLAAMLSLSSLTGCSSKNNAAVNTLGTAQTAEASYGYEETAETSGKESTAADTDDTESTAASIDKDGEYSSTEDVAAYINEFGCLPSNYITKSQAEKLGWVSSMGNLWEVAPGKSIGGGKFGNYEGLLPDKDGRQYYECDVNYEGGYRGDDRLIYSNDGLIYFTDDHYKTFELLYGEE